MTFRPPRQRRRGSAALAAVLMLLVLCTAVILASLSVTEADMAHARQARESAVAYYIAQAGFNEAVLEVRKGLDGEDHRASGLGALGITAPLPYLDSRGNRVGEYRTWVVDLAGEGEPSQQVVRVLAAVPRFATPSVVHAMQGTLGTKEVFLLTPNEGAVTLSGPLNAPALTGWDSPELLIDGGDVPGIILSDEPAYERFTDLMIAGHEDGAIDGSEVLGSPRVTLSSLADTFELALALEPSSSFSGDQLTAYREALRDYAESVVHASPVGDSVVVDYASAGEAGVVLVHELDSVKDGAGTGKPRIVVDQAFGTPSEPATVLVDTSRFYKGGNAMTDNHGRIVSGAGTLVILHPIGSSGDNATGTQFTLDWTGDVFVVGYPADATTGVGENAPSDNLLFISRSDWTIDGNLIVLSAGSTEASVELRGLGSDPARMAIEGSLLVFGEASAQEAEIDLEGDATLDVQGIVGVYGSRVEIESQSATSTELRIQGTLALGLPDGNERSDDFTWDVRGYTNIIYDREKVEAAIAGLDALHASMDVSSATVSKIMVTASASMSHGCDFNEFEAELESLESHDADLQALGVE